VNLQIATPRWAVPFLGPARYKGAYGGRGSGKSHFFAEFIVEDHVINPNNSTVCIREVQKTLDQSVKRLLEQKIEKLNAGYYFDVQDAKIKSKFGNGLISFQGMQNHTADSIKSLEGYQRAWVEEAQTLSQYSLDLLRPTIRLPDSEILFSWNPRYKTDPVDKFFRKNPPADAVSVLVNWRENPWFPEVLRKEMDHVIRILQAEGVNVIYREKPEDMDDVHNQVVLTNIPTNEIWGSIKDNGHKIVQTSRSKDATMATQWVNKSADTFCAASTIEEEALVKLLGRDRVALTGMPYLDVYHQLSKRPSKEEYLLGLQAPFAAHGYTFENPPEFLDDFYINYPKQQGWKDLRFRFHQNHSHYWSDSHIPTKDSLLPPFVDPVEKTPEILYNSRGLYTSYFSFMLMEACLLDKPIYIYHDNPEWKNKIEKFINDPGWWSSYPWHELEKESKRKELKEAFSVNLDGNSAQRVANEVLKFV